MKCQTGINQKLYKMKKFMLTLLVLGGIAFLGAIEAEAQQTEKKSEQQQAPQTPRPGFVDADGDGICDNYDGVRPGRGLGPGNGQGLGRANGQRLGLGQCLRNGSGQGQGQGQGLRTGPRNGTGPNCNPPNPQNK
jgi:hypothetical protein